MPERRLTDISFNENRTVKSWGINLQTDRESHFLMFSKTCLNFHNSREGGERKKGRREGGREGGLDIRGFALQNETNSIVKWRHEVITILITVYNNSSLSFRTRRSDITGQKLFRSGNKFIICFAWVTLNVAILGTKNSRRASRG